MRTKYHFAVPPQFNLSVALCSWPSSAYAVTGIPVPFYFHKDFFGTDSRRLQRCFSADACTVHILLYQVINRLLFLKNYFDDYTFWLVEMQERKL